MNKYSIVSYYTIGTSYEKVYHKYLRNSEQKYSNEGIDFKIFTTVDNGDWFKNTAEKPNIILRFFEQNPDRDCVFLDIDATIEKVPELFDNIPDCFDIAYHVLSWNDWYGYNSFPDKRELLTGTMYLRNNDKVKRLCKEWYEKATTSHIWEQKVLQDIILHSDVMVYPLPLEYCYMVSRPGNREPLVKLEPVILHHQVSRKLKRNLNGEID